jgi:3-hydroxybutyryl-CoA dehydrogenase
MSMNKVGIIGAGTMGNGVAQVCAMAGLQVAMIDVSQAALERGKAALGASLDRLVRKDTLSAADKAAALSRVQPSTSHEALRDADLVIEAATENVELKLRILKQVDEMLGPEGLIATNTSSISITQLAAVLRRPERFIGMHFFNPVPMMELLELIRGLQTSDETHARALQFAQAIGKMPISVKNSPGFAVNRILVPMINEAIFVLQEGSASAEYRPAPLLKEMVAAGRLGRKTGWGFYRYEEKA